MTSIREVGGEVEVVAGDKSYRAETLVVAAGAWTNPLLSHVGVEFPLEVTLEQVVYLDPIDGPCVPPLPISDLDLDGRAHASTGFPSSVNRRSRWPGIDARS